MKKPVAIICFMLATSSLALGHEKGNVDERKAAPAAETSAKDAVRLAALAKWCCRFTSLTGASRSITLKTGGVLAVSACWSAGLAVFPAIKNVRVSKGAC
jgi:hypothetical protein